MYEINAPAGGGAGDVLNWSLNIVPPKLGFMNLYSVSAFIGKLALNLISTKKLGRVNYICQGTKDRERREDEERNQERRE